MGDMGLGIGAIVCACVALLFTGLGFMLTAIPFVGTFLSFGAPLIAIAGVIMGGIGLSRASKEGQPTGLHIAGLVASFLALLPAVLVAVTCGLCNALCSAATLAPRRDGGYATTTNAPFDPTDDVQLTNPGQPLLPTDPSDPDPTNLTGAPSEAELAEGVDMLNELCGDTWCEGEFDFLFQRLVCEPDGACTLAFEARHYTRPEDAPYTPSTITVPGGQEVVACNAWIQTEDEDICDGRGLAPPWIDVMSTALADWEREARPR